MSRGRPIVTGCGTAAAYRRHLRAGETPCPECRAEWARMSRDRRRRANRQP